MIDELELLFDSPDYFHYYGNFKQFLPQKEQEGFSKRVAILEKKYQINNHSQSSLGGDYYSGTQENTLIIENEKHLQADSKNCPLCHEKIKIPFRSSCGHVCCFECWVVALKNKKECPCCGLKGIKVRSLSKEFFQ
jgi:hypothetical protein